MDPNDKLPVPRSVTRGQVIAALAVLSLNGDRIGHFHMDPDTSQIRVELFDVGTRFPRGLMDAAILRPVTVVEIAIEEE